MPIQITCTCGRELNLRDELAGCVIRCPSCSGALTVPTRAGQSKRVVHDGVAPGPPPRHRPTAPPTSVLSKAGKAANRAEEEVPEFAHIEVVEDDSEGGANAYGLQSEGAAAVNYSNIGALSSIKLAADAITSLAYGADHKTHLAADHDDLYFLDFSQRDWANPAKKMHAAPICCLAISADCRFALSGDEGGGLILWDALAQKPVQWLDGHRGELRTAAFSPDEFHAASAGSGGAVRLWNYANGKALSLEKAQMEQSVNAVCFSHDGAVLAAVGADGRARRWRVADGALLGKLDGGPADLGTAAFTKDWTALIAGSTKRLKACRWELDTGERTPCLGRASDQQGRFVRTWATPDGYAVLALRYNLKTPPRHRTDSAAPFGPVGPIVPMAVVSANLIWGAVKFTENLTMSTHAGLKRRYFLDLWDIANQVVVTTVEIGMATPSALAYSSDGHRVIAGFETGAVILIGL